MEGSIKDIRNVLGSYSHRSSDEMCTSRLAMMSSVRCGPSACCYDFECTEQFREDWKQSYKKSEKEPLGEVEEVEGTESDSVGSNE